MKVLVIGSGGREHAIAYKLNLSDKVSQIYAIPGNPGIASFGINVNGSVEDIPFILNFVKENQIDLTVIGPEVPLCLGLADVLEENGFKVFGPKAKAAMLEGSKAFSKEFMVRHNIPTAKYVEVNNYEVAIKAFKTVEEMDANKNYINPAEPLVAGIAREAQDRFHSSIFFAMEPSEVYALRKLKPTPASHGEHYISATRFNSIINKATEHSQIDFIG